MRRPSDILFLGSDVFSVHVLRAILERKDLYSSLSVVTPPPARTGRGKRQITKPALLELAETVRLPVYTPSASDLPSLHSQIAIPPSILLTASYGHLLPSSLLNVVPPMHAINIHPSLLPHLRGAAPIQWAIARRMSETGVSVQTMQDDVFDSGDILLQRRHTIGDNEHTFTSLVDELGKLAAKATVEVLSNLQTYQQSAYKQDTSQITHAPKVHRSIGFVDFSTMSAHTIDARHRAFAHQRPLSATLAQSNTTHQLHGVEVLSNPQTHPIIHKLDIAGAATLVQDHLVVKCAKNSFLSVHSLKPPGKRAIEAHEWWNGHRHDLDVVHFIKPERDA